MENASHENGRSKGDQNHRPGGPIAFFLMNLPACIAVIGAGLAGVAVLLSCHVALRDSALAAIGREPAADSDFRMGLASTGLTVSSGDLATVCWLIGVILLMTSLTLRGTGVGWKRQ